MSYDISICIQYYEIDSKTGEKIYKLREAKGILTTNKIYFRIEYILIFNQYIEGAFTILDLQTCINKIDGFVQSHILSDLPNSIIDYVLKVDQIYLATSWKKQGDPTLLLQIAKGIDFLDTLLLYFYVKSKKPANFFLIFEIPRDVSEPEDENFALFCKQSHKKAKLLAKKERKSVERL